MKYHALAVDYDGTLATDGQVDPATHDALHRLKESGRRLILVTGRIIGQLLEVFPQLSICDLVVADNGALLYDPRTGDQIALADPPSEEFIRELSFRGVSPIEVGDVIVATWEPHESTVLQVIRDMGLELQIIFNKGAVMILPTGCNKATGLRAALTRLGLSHHNTVGIGDAENDEAFLKLCAASAAVDNALEVVKRHVLMVTKGARGEGVVELIERILADDLQSLPLRPDRGLLMGHHADDQEYRVPLYGSRILVMGESADAQAYCVLRMLQQLVEQDYQACLFTANGEYLKLQNPVVLGTAEQKPDVDEFLQVIQDPHKSCIVNLQYESINGKSAVFQELLSAAMEHRHKTGHPHLVLVDDTDKMLTSSSGAPDSSRTKEFTSSLFINRHPERLNQSLVGNMDFVLAVGKRAETILAKCCGMSATTANILHDAVAWRRADRSFEPLRILPSSTVGRTAAAPVVIR
jgi:hydroxymethylpyrimidine pyrophosphatase-like HAD family hydrolase